MLDELMMGGIPLGMITEISGAPGTGKSQFCLGCLADLAVREIACSSSGSSSSSSSISGHAIYFDTELKFNADRLREIIIARAPTASTAEIDAALSKVSVRKPTTCRALREEVEGECNSYVHAMHVHNCLSAQYSNLLDRRSRVCSH